VPLQALVGGEQVEGRGLRRPGAVRDRLLQGGDVLGQPGERGLEVGPARIGEDVVRTEPGEGDDGLYERQAAWKERLDRPIE
jgi:hypothetical protein